MGRGWGWGDGGDNCLPDIWTLLFTCPSMAFFFFFDIAVLFVYLILIEYVVCSVLMEHVQHFEPQLGCLQRDSVL